MSRAAIVPLAGTAPIPSATSAFSTRSPRGYDTIAGLDAATDLFDLPVAVTGVDPAIASGGLSEAKFNPDLAVAANAATLLAHHAAAFTPDRGAHAGETFLIVDANGIAGYQAREDFVLRLATPPTRGAARCSTRWRRGSRSTWIERAVPAPDRDRSFIFQQFL